MRLGKNIYKNRKANYLSAHGGLEEKEDCSWKEKIKALRYFFKKSTEFLFDRDKLVKGLWANLEQFAKMCQCISI